MIIKNEFLNKLKDFGLNSYEAKLWTALLSRGVSTAGELSDIANVPRSRSYDVLESLEKKGFIIIKIGKPIKYLAVPPSEVIERVKRKIQEETKEQINNLNTIKNSEILKELDTLHKQGSNLINPNELLGLIKGRNNIYEHIESVLKRAEKSVILFTTKDGLQRKHEFFKKTLEKLKEKGVKIKIAAPLHIQNEKIIKELKTIANLAHVDNFGRFIVVDGKEVIFIITGEETNPTYDTAIWVNSTFLAKSFENLTEKSLEARNKQI